MTKTTINPDDKCQTCQQTYGWHQEHKPVHPFNTGEAGAKALLGARRSRDTDQRGNGAQAGSERAAWPFDPVLRQALIDKGVLTPDDLRAAEEKIRAVTAQFMEGMDGQGKVQV